MLEIRTFDVGSGAVIAVSGDLDANGAAQVAAEALRRGGGPVILDLLRARFVDLDVVDALVSAVGGDATFVAERTLEHALQVVGLHQQVTVEPSLAAALRS